MESGNGDVDPFGNSGESLLSTLAQLDAHLRDELLALLNKVAQRFDGEVARFWRRIRQN